MMYDVRNNGGKTMILDCGHEEDKGYPATIQKENGTIETVQGWTWAFSLDGIRKLCHSCHSKEILDCGHTIGEHSFFTSGYGENLEGKKICYACCAEQDKKDMIETGKAILYLTEDSKTNMYKVTNWPASLTFNATVRKGKHNLARTRYDAWFTGPDGKNWHGVTYGDDSQLCHCKRIK